MMFRNFIQGFLASVFMAESPAEKNFGVVYKALISAITFPADLKSRPSIQVSTPATSFNVFSWKAQKRCNCHVWRHKLQGSFRLSHVYTEIHYFISISQFRTIIFMIDKLKKLERIHIQAESLLASLVLQSSHADFGSDLAYRLNRMVDLASTRLDRRLQAKLKALEESNRIPTSVSLGYITVDGVLKHCISGPQRKLPADFKEWANHSLNLN